MRKDWAVKRLGDVCDFFNGQAHENSIDENGNYKVINSKFISSEGLIYKRTNNALSPLFKDDIVMVMSDVPKGKTLAKCFIVDEDNTYTLNQRICVIRSSMFDTKFLFYQLNRNMYLLSFDNGENQTNLRKDDILNCELLVPPLPEQQRIVNILDESFAAIAKAKENAEKNLANARGFFESYLRSIFANPGEGWEKMTLLEACEIKPPKREARTSLKGTDFVSFVPMEDMGIEQKFFSPTTERMLNKVEGSYTYFVDGDVLLAKITPCFENGKLGIARNLKNGIGFGSSEYIVFRAKEYLLPEFLYYFLLRPEFRIEGAKRMTGAVGHKRVAKEYVENTMIPLPPVPEQRFIVSQFDTLVDETKKLEINYRQKLADLEELKSCVLQKAFKGEL
jgi:type I restriction enzyme S subunit